MLLRLGLLTVTRPSYLLDVLISEFPCFLDEKLCIKNTFIGDSVSKEVKVTRNVTLCYFSCNHSFQLTYPQLVSIAS